MVDFDHIMGNDPEDSDQDLIHRDFIDAAIEELKSLDYDTTEFEKEVKEIDKRFEKLLEDEKLWDCVPGGASEHYPKTSWLWFPGKIIRKIKNKK